MLLSLGCSTAAGGSATGGGAAGKRKRRLSRSREHYGVSGALIYTPAPGINSWKENISFWLKAADFSLRHPRYSAPSILAE